MSLTNGDKRLVITNTPDRFGRFGGQDFSVWDTKRRVLVYPRDPRRQCAEMALNQYELNFEGDPNEEC